MDDQVVAIGAACRYPDAHTPGQLWETVLHRREAFRRIPACRLPIADYGSTDRDDVDRTYLTHAAVLEGWEFARQRFRVPWEVFRAVDLTHWLALEVAADALADAGLPHGDGTDRARVGVVVGNSLTGEFSRAAALRVRWPYVRRAVAAVLATSELAPPAQAALLDDLEHAYKAPFPAPSDETLAGALANTIAGRICNYFDFHGTAHTVDAACASSLVAIASAADAVAAGTLEVALAGGVDLSLDPFELVGFARVGALAENAMRVFDAAPTGFLPGEGCGMVVLCRESYAAARGLRPYARLVGWATSADGNGGLTRPELAGQRLALERAYTRAGLVPGAVGLVEGHGTGTAVGDDTELRTLLAVRGAAPAAALGSVKANIGHTKAAAGAAGAIKAALALHHRMLPPTTGCQRPHPLLAEAGSSLRVLPAPEPWDGTAPRYAAVSAMGFGGVNAHLVLASADGPTGNTLTNRGSRPHPVPTPDREVVVCGAPDAAGLAIALDQIAGFARTASRAELTDLAAHLATTHRGDAPARFATVAAAPEELAAAAARAAAAVRRGERLLFDEAQALFVSVGPPMRVGLLCSGQAAPAYRGLGALGALLPSVPAGSDVTVEVPVGGTVDTRVAQPAILRSSLAGLAWLAELGVRAAAATGHSLGEITALCWAGALAPGDAAALVRVRGAAMAGCRGAGAMLGLAASLEAVTALVRGGDAVVAADNGPDQVVVSGPREAVERVAADAARSGIASTALPVSHAFHSPMMAPAVAELRAHLAEVAWRRLSGRVASTIAGDWLAPDADLPELLTSQLTAPVRFRAALARLRTETDLLVEVGPGRVLTGLARTADGGPVVAMDAGSPSVAGVATTTAALFAAGAAGTVAPYLAGRFARPVDLARVPRFLTNPCEEGVATVDGADVPAAPAPPASRPALPSALPPAPGPAVAAPPVPASGPDHLVEHVVAQIAAVAGLEPSSLGPDTRPLVDLHLSSLRVSQLTAKVATGLGKAPPAAPLTLTDATIADIAAAITELPTLDGPEAGAEAVPAGVTSWVRTFADTQVPEPAPGHPQPNRRWWVVGPPAGHPAADAIAELFPAGPEADARLLVLPPGLADLPVEAVVTALRDSAADQRPLLVLHQGGIGAAVGRSLAVEHPDVPVLVVEAPATPAGVRLAAAEAAHGLPEAGFSEVVYRPDGLRTRRRLAPLPLPPRRDHDLPLGDGEVCLVSGGAKGIGAECAAALAEATGAVVVLVGRGRPDDPQVRAGLDRIASRGGKAHYVRADVTDASAAAQAVRAAAGRGPVRGLIHAAGRNLPGRIAALTPQGLDATLAPKAYGFDHLLAALDLGKLRFAVTFGSVIGRIGLAGEAEYAIANEWLARRCRGLAADRPGVRWLNIAWSVWSGAGMGVRLGSLDGLVRLGLFPIPVAAGTDLLLRLLAAPELPPDVVVAGRLPASSTLRWQEGPRPTSRFLESWRAHTPGVEAIVEASVSSGTDPYLLDHRIDGVEVLPAVLGLEAMVQAAQVLRPGRGPVELQEVGLRRAITVPSRHPRTLRVAALAGEDGTVAIVTRSDETDFAVDHFRAVLAGGAGAPPPARRPALPATVPIDAAPLYGPLFFHGQRFRRVRGYRALGAYRCVAEVVADPTARWFGDYHDSRLILGDPGARDAYLHVLQGCVPDRRVLPVAVERITVHRPPAGRLTVAAWQRDQDAEQYVFDLLVSDDQGRPYEQWHGLVLRDVGPLAQAPLPPVLVGPYLARRLRERLPGVDLAVAEAGRDDRRISGEVAGWLLGVDPLPHAPDGRIQAPDRAGASASHLAGHVLVAAGTAAVAVDWERVEGEPPVGAAAAGLAAQLAASGFTPAEAGTRLWTCLEAMHKLGLPPGTPVALERAGDNGWIWLASGGFRFASVVIDSTLGPLAVCVGTEPAR